MLKTALLLALTCFLLTACQQNELFVPQSKARVYAFNTGQVDNSYAYTGTHRDDFTVELTLTEREDQKTEIKVIIVNALAGETYSVGAYDKVDPATNNGLPFSATPNTAILSETIIDKGVTFVSDQSFDELVNNYEGFLIIHDPLQAISGTDPSTYLILGDFTK